MASSLALATNLLCADLLQFVNRPRDVCVWGERQALGQFDQRRLGDDEPGVTEPCGLLDALVEIGDGFDLAAQSDFNDGGGQCGRGIRTHSESLERCPEGGRASRPGTDGEWERYGRVWMGAVSLAWIRGPADTASAPLCARGAAPGVERGPRALHPGAVAQNKFRLESAPIPAG